MDENDEKPARDSRKATMITRHLKEYGHPGSVAGITFALILVLFTLGGWWLDGKFGTSPLWVLIGFGCGAVGGFIHLVEKVSPGTLFGKRGQGPKRAGDGDAASCDGQRDARGED